MKKDPFAKEGYVYVMDYYTGCPVYYTNEEYAALQAEEERRQKQDRLHILEGYLIVFENWDFVFKIVKEPISNAETKNILIRSLYLSKKQASAILQMKLKKLDQKSQEKIKNEYLKLKEELSMMREES